MGTFLGNLQVLDASEEQIATLLPRAVTGCWSERFITVLHESYGFGSVEQPAKKLSKQLLQATVLAVGLADSDALELSVWQGGKRIAAQIDGYEGSPAKKGDPKRFCAALGLPEEDVPRLKAVWTKGDAEEKLALTAALLAAPLHCRVDWLPKERAVRDTAMVDQWLAQRPDPPKVKNQTRAELIQELTGVDFRSYSFMGEPARPLFSLHHVDAEGWSDRTEDEWCLTGPDGLVERTDPKLDPRPEVDGLPCFCDSDYFPGHWELCYLETGGGRVLGLARQWLSSYRQEYQVVEDSAGLLAVPFSFKLDGDLRDFHQIWSMEDGGVLVWYQRLNLCDSHGPRTPFDLVRYAPDGTILWRRQFGEAAMDAHYLPKIFWDSLLWIEGPEDFFSVDLDGRDYSHIGVKTHDQEGDRFSTHDIIKDQETPGEVWLARNTTWYASRCTVCSILRFDRQGTLLREDSLPEGVSKSSFSLFLSGLLYLPDRILLISYNEGIWMLDRASLSAVAGTRDCRNYLSAVQDGAGRIWVSVGGSTLEAYDKDLKLLSRHRLKGYVSSNFKLDRTGRLTVRTYDDRKHILRVYRLN